MSAKDNETPRGKKLLIFKLITYLFPLILFMLLEVVLRISGYGFDTSLFIKYSRNDRFMQVNPHAAFKFFSDTLNATQGSSEIFTVDKAPNTFRIFVLGESTTIGYPYFHNGSFHRWLQFRLMQMYPDRNFEIINVSMTALNSYAVLDFGKQVAQYEPDAIMIYTGHNEYYGALGIGSTSHLGNNRRLTQLLIKLRSLRFVQLFDNILHKISHSFSGKTIDTRENLMKRMAANQTIPFGSKDFQAGIAQFRDNMDELCSFFNDKKIPVFLSTVVSNEKDQPPFISNGSGPGSALSYFKAGQLAVTEADYTHAKHDFVMAKELDELRFRAPDAINDIILKIAARYSNVHLVEAKKLFETYSPHGIIGKETILEHVHPNLYGYALLSEAFYRAFQQQRLIPDTPQRVMTFNELRQEMPITRMDSLIGEIQIMTLKAGWPFNEPAQKPELTSSIEDTLANAVTFKEMEWRDAMEYAFEHDRQVNDKKRACLIAEAMILEYPYNDQFCGLAATLNAGLGNYDLAALYYKKLAAITSTDQYAPRIIKLYLRAGEADKALLNIKLLKPEQQTLVKEILNEIVAAKKTIHTNPGDHDAIDLLMADYKKLGLPDSLVKRDMK